MRLLAVFFAALTLTGCSRIAVLKEITPVYAPVSEGVSVDIDSHAKAFREISSSEQKNPLETTEAYLTTLQKLARELDRTPADPEVRNAYNFALDRIFSLIRAHNYNPWDKVPMKIGKFNISFKEVPRAGWHPATYEFLPTAQVEVGGEYLQHMSLRKGLGATLVAIGRTPKTEYLETFSQERTYYGVTAVVEFKGNTCRLSFHDPLDEETVRVGRHSFPLAADYTTPLAVLLTRERPQRLGIPRLFDPDKYAETARLSRLRPYNSDRIPLLLVHGLLDTPATWVPMINALRTDPIIREKYQIWVYSYPSGYPYPYAASLLRRELDRVREVFPGHKPIVFVGHSMGGMIGRLMLTDSGEKIWNAYFRRPPEKVRMPSREKKLMKNMLIFQSRPDISRAVFICTPHRGAELAGSWIGRLGRRFVRVPLIMVTLGETLRDNVTFSRGSSAYESLPTSIDTLTLDNPFVKAVDKLPLNPAIPFHSIMGDRGKSGAQLDPLTGSDSFVSYTSSHLDGARSECIIPSDHSGHQDPDGIAEVTRILHLHLKSAR